MKMIPTKEVVEQYEKDVTALSMIVLSGITCRHS